MNMCPSTNNYRVCYAILVGMHEKSKSPLKFYCHVKAEQIILLIILYYILSTRMYSTQFEQKCYKNLHAQMHCNESIPAVQSENVSSLYFLKLQSIFPVLQHLALKLQHSNIYSMNSSKS